MFEPEALGFKVEPIGRCLANLVLGDVIRPVTCNPFYKRVKLSKNARNRSNVTQLPDTSESKEALPEISVF